MVSRVRLIPAADDREHTPMEAMSRLVESPTAIINVLGVVYAHTKTHDGGDLYLTPCGLPFADLLQIENWYESSWFRAHRERLSGTSSVFRVPSKSVGGYQLDLVVKQSRMGEDVPIDTQTLIEFLRTEFNSPWEEFSLVMELREGLYGPEDLHLQTQQPLAIYVPPEQMQLRQTGRSRHKMQRIVRRHPGIDLDILRQYKLVYGWIHGLDIVQAFREVGVTQRDLVRHLTTVTQRVIDDMRVKGFVVADMKPAHIIIGDNDLREMRALADGDSDRAQASQVDYLHALIQEHRYSVIDYELLMRTEEHQAHDLGERRSSYLHDQCERFKAAPVPPFLLQSEIFGVPYIHGHVESTGGLLWVVGRNPNLFDYFLPERWRRTPSRSMSSRHEVYDAVTKDNVHIVWRVSRVGEAPILDEPTGDAQLAREYGINSPFEEFGIAQELNDKGIATVYVRAIYMTGSLREEPIADERRFATHRHLLGIDGMPILRKRHHYIRIHGYYNGPDEYVAAHDGHLYESFDLPQAVRKGVIVEEEALVVLAATQARLRKVGFDGSLMEMNDLLVTRDPNGNLVRDGKGLPETRICNLELIHRL